MPGGSRYAQGNVILEMVLGFTATPPSQSANTEQVLTYTVPGVQVNDFVEINQLNHISNLGISNIWVSAANTISIQWFNPTASGATGVSTNFLLTVTRYENPVPFSQFPTGIV